MLDTKVGGLIKTFLIATTFGLAYGGIYAYEQYFAPKQKKPKPPKQFNEGGFAQNSLSPYEQLSTVLGTRRVPAPYLAPAWVQIEGENTFGRGIMGLAGRHDFIKPYVNGSPIEVIEDNYLTGDDSDADPIIYTETVWQEAGTEFSRHSLKTSVSSDERWELAHSPTSADVNTYDLPKWHWYRLGNKALPSEVVFDIFFSRGVYKTSDEKAGIAFQCVLKDVSDSLIYLPEAHILANAQSPFHVKIRLIFTADPTGGTALSSSSAWRVAFCDAGHMTPHEADAYYDGSGVTAAHTYVEDDGTTLVIYVDPDEVNVAVGMFCGIKASAGYFSDRIDTSDGSYEFNGGVSFDWDYFGRVTDTGVYKAIEDQSKAVTDCQLKYITRFYDVIPLEPNGAACYEFMTQNQQVDQVTVLAQRYVDRIWDRVSEAWVTAPHISSNPAAIALHIMTTTRAVENNRPLTDAQISLAEFGEWWEFCDDRGYECNAYIEGGSWTEALDLCFEAGFGKQRFVTQYGVYLEKDRSAEDPVLVLSPRNSNNFEARISFARKPHALRVTFDDEEDDYQTSAELIVYAPGYSEDGAGGTTAASLFEAKHYRSITKRWHAELRGQIDINLIWLRNNDYSIDTDMRHLVGHQGKVVAVSHFVLSDQHDWAAIVRVMTNTVGGGEKIVGLELDGKVQLQAATTGIRISKLDGETLTSQTTMTGYGNTVTFDTPLDVDAAIAAGATVVFGVVDEESIRCIVEGAVPNASLGATLRLVDEAPEIFT